jgi:6-phosphogluconate dehydrogenase
MVMIGDPRAETRGTGEWWRGLSAEERVDAIVDIFRDSLVRVVSAAKNGRVIIEAPDISAGETGRIMRAKEQHLRQLDDGIRLYRKQKPDTNALRRLRGVIVNED